MRCAHKRGSEVTLCGVPVDPCVYEEIETHRGVTVHVMRCVNCGHIEIDWEREDNNGDT